MVRTAHPTEANEFYRVRHAHPHQRCYGAHGAPCGIA